MSGNVGGSWTMRWLGRAALATAGLALVLAAEMPNRQPKRLLARQGSYREPASATDYRAMAGALNECLNRLSRDMAEALRPLTARGLSHQAGSSGLALDFTLDFLM